MSDSPDDSSLDDDGRALSRALRWVAPVSIAITLISAVLFYRLYWVWRGQFYQGTVRDPDTGALYFGAYRVWGLVALAAAVVAFASSLALWWRRETPRQH